MFNKYDIYPGVKRFFFLFVIIILPFQLLAASTERELFSEAESRYLSNNYVAAYETYDEFVKKFPLSDLIPDAQYKKAVCLFRLGRYSESLKLYELIEKRYRSTRFIDYVPFWKGVSYFQIGNYAHARQSLHTFLLKTDDPVLTPDALLYKSLAEVAEGDYHEAQITMDRLIQKKGYDGLTPYEAVFYSYILLNDRKYNQLIQFQEEINSENFPSEWREKFILYRAEGYLHTGDIEKAEESYSLLIDAGLETASVAYRRLYLFAQKRDDFSQKEWIVQHAEKKLSDHPEILRDFWMMMGIESFQRREMVLAEHYLKKVWNAGNLQDVPEIVPLYLSQIYMMKDQRDSAAQTLEEYLKVSEKKASLAFFNLGSIYASGEKYGSAAENLRRYIELKPGGNFIQNARYLLAYSEYRQARLDEALRQCMDFLEAEARGSAERERGSEDDREKDLHNNVMRLYARILIKMNRDSEALQIMEEWAEKNPEDVKARLDLLKLHFSMKSFGEVLSESSDLLMDVPELVYNDLRTFLLLHYLRGLSQISMKQYMESLSSLSEITLERVSETGLISILPYVIYYRAWAQYRINNLDIAITLADDFISEYPDHELAKSALYLGAWCSYSNGDYGRAEELFSLLARKSNGELSIKALFLQGKSARNLDRREEASRIFMRIHDEYSGSSYADDALFEYAGILQEERDTGKAAEAYYELWERYPDSALAEEALYKRGEIYFSDARYRMAKNAFREYRRHIPDGTLTDASLYWEAVSSRRIGEEREAVILWEEMIASYPESSFRSDAIRGTAEVYASFGEYPRAASLYTVLIGEYPEYSKSINAALRLEEIRYLKFGLSKREAEITARISQKGGVGTKEGRKAMIELARLYVYEEESKLERAYQILNQVLQQADADTSAEAGVLLGEYYFIMGDHDKAGREFFYASLKNPSDRDLMAYAIYRAAQSMKLAGKTREVKELVQRLEENFPSSGWSDKGKKLLEDFDE